MSRQYFKSRCFEQPRRSTRFDRRLRTGHRRPESKSKIFSLRLVQKTEGLQFNHRTEEVGLRQKPATIRRKISEQIRHF